MDIAIHKLSYTYTYKTVIEYRHYHCDYGNHYKYNYQVEVVEVFIVINCLLVIIYNYDNFGDLCDCHIDKSYYYYINLYNFLITNSYY